MKNENKKALATIFLVVILFGLGLQLLPLSFNAHPYYTLVLKEYDYFAASQGRGIPLPYWAREVGGDYANIKFSILALGTNIIFWLTFALLITVVFYSLNNAKRRRFLSGVIVGLWLLSAYLFFVAKECVNLGFPNYPYHYDLLRPFGFIQGSGPTIDFLGLCGFEPNRFFYLTFDMALIATVLYGVYFVINILKRKTFSRPNI